MPWRQTDPLCVSELHRRAAGWYAAQGLLDAAIAHALAAGDHLSAARWIESAVDAALHSGDIAPLRGWLAALPEALVWARPRLMVGQLWLQFILGQNELIPSGIDALAAALTAEPDGDAVRSIEDQAWLRAELAALRAQRALHLGALSETLAQCRAGLAVAPAGALRIRGALELLQGTAVRIAGDLAAAATHFDTARDLAEQGGGEQLLLYVANNLADLAELRGQLGAMIAEHARMRRLSVDASGQPLPLAGMALIGMGKVARERNDLEAAAALLTEGIDLGRRSAISGIVIDGLLVLALVQVAQRNVTGARAHLDEAAELAERWHPATVGARVAAFRARLALAAGRIQETARWAVGVSARVDAPSSELGEIEQLTLARVWLAQGRAAEALGLLARLEQAARRGARHGRLAEILALRALAQQAAGCSNQAIADRLIISVATVRKHVENIHGKLGVQSRTQAAARARELGLA